MTKIVQIYRSIIVVFFICFFGVGALVVRYCLLPFKKERIQKYETLQKSWQIYISLLKFFKVIEFEPDNSEILKNIKNSIIVSTHPSFLDIVLLMSIIPHSTCFVADKLARNPFFKGMVKLLFILEGQPMDKWVNDACEMLENGINIIIFPMGGRHMKDEHPRIRRGAALIARKSKRNIVMLQINNDFAFLAGHQPVYRAGSKPTVYTIKYLGEINTAEYIEKYPDEVDFKTEISKEIAKNLYAKE
ncbi:1-acyl-sn-glycerol-3-phosphate acyltransferase [bacterium]|nr:1-acyl-sn-glycerol-3-phosphate acyltransferase [bacterium]